MRLLVGRGDGNLYLEEYYDNIPSYAILSHTWGADGEEVTFRDLMEDTGKNKAGYKKIEFCRNQAARDDLQHFWVDTCCIDKSSSAELTEAINSMYRWYQQADKCYVYLSDVSSSGDVINTNPPRTIWEAAFRQSRWFRRGWTLQELIAPASVEFFSQEGDGLGDKGSLEQIIFEITKIPVKALHGAPLTDFEVEERMSWASHRQTKKQEDGAYSLMGLFDIHMPLIYGEGGPKAFVRLREEIDKSSKLNLQNAPQNRYFIVSKDISTKHVERRDLLLSLEHHLTPAISTSCGGKRVVLVGMSGSGKTELAARFAKLHRHNYEALLWLDCSSERSLDNSFTRIAEKLSQTTFQDSRRCRSFCQDWLCDNKNWLLIADRLDDEETLQSFQTDFMSLGMEGDILATSTNFNLALLWSSVEVGKMSLSEGLELLRKILGESSSRPGNGQDGLTALVGELGYLALAINQAGCYIRQQALTATEYHKLLQKQKPLSLVRGSILPYPPSQYSRLWTAFELSFERLEEVDRRASQLLFLLTMLKSEETKLDLLLSRTKFQGYWAESGEFEEVPLQAQRWIPYDLENVFHERHVLLEAIAGLRRFAFIRLNEKDMSISLHPLVQSWSLHRMSQQEGLIDRFKSCAIGVVCSKLMKQDLFPPFLLRAGRYTHMEERKLSPWPWRQYHAISKYALQCLQYICELPRMESTTANQGLALLQFLEYASSGSYMEQYTLGQEVLKSVKHSCDKYIPDSDNFLHVSVLVWTLVRALKCNCRKTGTNCEVCSEAHHSALSIYKLDDLYWISKRSLAGRRCLHQVLPRSDLPLRQLASHPLSVRPSWIEKYLMANYIFEVITLSRPVETLSYTGKGELELQEAVLLFRQLGELDSDEHRRSLWHLTTYWWHKKLWSEIIVALEPLVESSLKCPVSDWSHERCIIRLVGALLKLDQWTEATEVLNRVKEAYEAHEKSIRTIQNSSLLNESQVESLLGASTPLSSATEIPPLVGRDKMLTSHDPWQVFVKSHTGKTHTLDAYPHMMVDDLISDFGRRDSGYEFNATECRFLFGGKQLELHRMLSDYGIQKGSTIHLVLRLHGGQE